MSQICERGGSQEVKAKTGTHCRQEGHEAQGPPFFLFSYLTLTSKVHLTIKFNPNTSVVSVVVHRVTNLNETSHTFLPNPYVKTYLVEAVYSSNVRDIYSKKKTKVKKNTVNPVFEDTLEYFIPQYNLK